MRFGTVRVRVGKQDAATPNFPELSRASAATGSGPSTRLAPDTGTGTVTTAPRQGLRIKRSPHTGSIQHFSVRVSLEGIEPVEFRVKSDLRNHQAIVQPRLKRKGSTGSLQSLMVTQITLKTERFRVHGLPSDRLPAEVDPPDGEVLLHLNRLDCGQHSAVVRLLDGYADHS